MTDSQNTTPLPEEITEAVAINSIKSIAEQPAVLANLALANLINNVNISQQNAIANQQAMNQIQATVTGKLVNLLTTLGPLEAMSAQQLLTNNSLAQDLADLKAIIESFSPPAAPTSEQQKSS